MNVTVRPAERKDAALILSFIQGLADYEKMSDEVVATVESLEETIFDKKQAEVLLLEEGTMPAGFALFFHNYSTFLGRAGMYLEDLFVKPDFRGKGYGKRLFQEVAQLAVERQCGRMEWSCLDWNQPSIEFYRAMGAVPMDDWTVYRLTGDSLQEAAKGTKQDAADIEEV